MTDASASGGTEPGAVRPDDSGERWEALIDDLRKCGHATLDRVSNRARMNVTRARKGEYGVEAWLDDVKWFWQEVAQDTTDVVGGFQKRREQ